jgi:hypothetical protein
MVSDAAVKFRVAPVGMVTDERKFADQRKLPADAASHTLIPVTTSLFVPAQEAHDGVFVNEIAPAAAAPNVAAGRVVTDDTFDVPTVPAPVLVWS